MSDADLSEVVTLLAAAAQASGRQLDDPLLAVEAAKLAAVALGSSLGPWIGLMRNTATGDEDDTALRLKRYTVEEVTGVTAVHRDGAASPKAQITTRAMKDGELVDEKPMSTEFLDDPIAKEVAGRAKALIGHPAVIFRHNEAAPKGYTVKTGSEKGTPVREFRRIVWIDAADRAGAEALAARAVGAAPRVQASDLPPAARADTPPPVTTPPVQPPAAAQAAPPVQEPPPSLPVPPAAGGPFAATLAIFAASGMDDDTPIDMVDGATRQFQLDFQELRSEGQAALRDANKAAGRPVPVLGRPANGAEVRCLNQLASGALTSA